MIANKRIASQRVRMQMPPPVWLDDVLMSMGTVDVSRCSQTRGWWAIGTRRAILQERAAEKVAFLRLPLADGR